MLHLPLTHTHTHTHTHTYSYVEIPNQPHSKMIVTQAPLTGTSRDFWRMVWEQRTAVVVAMTTAEEKWWPEGHGGQQRHSLVVGRSWADGEIMGWIM